MQTYMGINATRLDPLNLSYFPVQPTEDARDGQQVTAVFFGDSQAAQWPAPTSLPQLQFYNRGIGAQTSAQIGGRFEAHVGPLHPDILILQMGINDLKTIPLFPQQRDQIVAQLQRNILTVVNQSQEQGATVILTTIFPTGTPPLTRLLVWSSEINTAVADANQYIRSLAVENVLILDADLLLADDTGHLNPTLAVDELHLNDAGYKQLNQSLIQKLTALNTPEKP